MNDQKLDSEQKVLEWKMYDLTHILFAITAHWNAIYEVHGFWHTQSSLSTSNGHKDQLLYIAPVILHYQNCTHLMCASGAG